MMISAHIIWLMNKTALKKWRYKFDRCAQDSQLLGEFIQAIEEVGATMDDLAQAGFTKRRIAQIKYDMSRFKLDPQRPQDVATMMAMIAARKDRPGAPR